MDEYNFAEFGSLEEVVRSYFAKVFAIWTVSQSAVNPRSK